MSSVNIYWEVLVPGHAWIKTGGSPSVGIRLRQVRAADKGKHRVTDPLLVSAVKRFTSSELGRLDPNASQISTFITNMIVHMDF